MTALLLLGLPSSAMAGDTASADLQAIYRAKDDGFVSLKGALESEGGSSGRTFDGTIDFAGLKCRLVENRPEDPGDNVYDCRSGDLPEASGRALTRADVEAAYGNVKQAVDGAIPGIRWFNVGNYGKQEVAGFDRSNLVVDLRLLGGPKNSVVSVTISSRSFRRD